MKTEVKAFGKKVLKVTGAACIATGIVLASAFISSGAAVSSVTEGFRAAKEIITDIFSKKELKTEQETV